MFYPPEKMKFLFHIFKLLIQIPTSDIENPFLVNPVLIDDEPDDPVIILIHGTFKNYLTRLPHYNQTHFIHGTFRLSLTILIHILKMVRSSLICSRNSSYYTYNMICSIKPCYNRYVITEPGLVILAPRVVKD